MDWGTLPWGVLSVRFGPLPGQPFGRALSGLGLGVLGGTAAARPVDWCLAGPGWGFLGQTWEVGRMIL